MSVPFVDLKAQYLNIKRDIDEAIASIIDQTRFIGGQPVKDFEEAFADYLGAKSVVSCANGTDSMEMILQALGVGPGDEVIVPANSWISTAEVVNNVGAEPVFVDVIERECNMDPGLIEDAITDQTKAIIPVHLYGLPARMPEIMAIADKFNLLVIEDCAQAHGAHIDGRLISSFGSASSFSFYPGKNLGAYGDAGGMVTNHDELATKLRMLGNHGQLKKHEHKIIGRNSRMDTLQAAILGAKLPHLPKWIDGRKRAAGWYDQYLKEEIIKPKVPKGFSHVYHLYVIRTKHREELMRAFTTKQIGYSVHYPTPLPLLPSYLYKGHEKEDFQVSDKLSKEIISLPIYPEITEDQVRYVSDVVNEFG